MVAQEENWWYIQIGKDLFSNIQMKKKTEAWDNAFVKQEDQIKYFMESNEIPWI